MSALPSLTSSPLNLITLRDDEKKTLIELLNKVEGDKCIILDMQLSKPLMMVTRDASVLKECGVKTFVNLNSPVSSISEPNTIFFIKPCCSAIKTVSAAIHKFIEDGIKTSFFLFLFPCLTRITREMMKDTEIIDLVTVLDTNMDLYPLDDDILSLEWYSSFSDLFLNNDYTSLQLMANALMRIQSLYGVIPHVTAIGANAAAVVEMISQKRVESKEKESDLPPEIDHLIVIDRSMDLVTPFVVPLTYEGLLDEVAGIDCGVVTIPEKNGKTEKMTTVRLNNTDAFFQELRDENIAKVIRALNEKAKQVKEEADTRPIDSSSSISEIAEFKQKLPEILLRRKLLECHLNLVSAVTSVTNGDSFHWRWEQEHRILGGDGSVQEIIDMGDQGASYYTVLKLLVLQCLVNNGLPPKSFDSIRRDLVQLYGFQCIPLLNHLQQMHLLFPKETAGNFSTLRSRMRLVQDGVDGLNNLDMTYITSGYAPLTGRLVQAILTQGGVSQEILKILNSPVRELNQIVSCPHRDTGMRKKVALVVFVGGATYTEVAAMRQLKYLEDFGYEIMMLVSNLTNGSKILHEMQDDLPLIPMPPKQNSCVCNKYNHFSYLIEYPPVAGSCTILKLSTLIPSLPRILLPTSFNLRSISCFNFSFLSSIRLASSWRLK